MRKTKLLTAILPFGIVCSTLPMLATTTSCHDKDKTVTEMKITDPEYGKESYGFYSDLLGFEADAAYFGFKLQDGLEVSKLKVEITNLQGFVGETSLKIVDEQNNYFDVWVAFSSEEILSKQTATFDLVFTYEEAKTTISGLSVSQFTHKRLRVTSLCGLTQELGTLKTDSTITYTIPSKFYYYYGFEAEEVSDKLYVELESPENGTMTIVPTIIKDPEEVGAFNIQFTISNKTAISDSFYITVKHKQLPDPLYSRYCYLSVYQGAEQCFDFEHDWHNEVWITKSRCTDTDIVIPEKVTLDSQEYTIVAIQDGVFSGDSFIKTIKLPDTIKRIKDYAFADCTGLETIHLPKNLESISLSALEGCNLQDITVDPENIYYSSRLNDVEQHCLLDIRDKSDVIYVMPLKKEEITIPEGVHTIGEQAFCNNEVLKTITIADSVKTIKFISFNGCKNLENLIFGENSNLTTIEQYAFDACSSLKDFKFPKKLQTIGDKSFMYCHSLTTIEIPASVTEIKNDPFDSCNGIQQITVDSNNTKYSSQASVGGTSQECYYVHPIGQENLIQIGCPKTIWPDGVTEIGANAFAGQQGLGEITIPATVQKIDDYAFLDSGVKSITLADSSSLANIGQSAFAGCNQLKTFDLSKSKVSSLGKNCLIRCEALETVLFPNTLANLNTTINSPYLTTLDFGANNTVMTSLPDSALEKCSTLKTITNWPANISKIGAKAFKQCSRLEDIHLTETITSVGEESYYGCIGITSVTIPSTIKTLPKGLFNTCLELKTVTLHDEITVIPDKAFESCLALESIDLSNITSIGNRSFCNCRTLTEITIPASVKSIDNYAFDATIITSATFAVTDGWKYDDGSDVDQTILQDPTKAAELLKDGYKITHS